MKPYAMYLRKSRADRDAELRGEGDTLERHLRMLTDLAHRMKLPIGRIYSEVVSGESIDSRPAMLELLADVEKCTWTGVLVVEVERLARGDTSDQGRVAKTFKYSNTLIVTPSKTYDPNNESDEEYFEFGLFMSRREYKTINRRMQAGRVSSIMEGKYVGNVPPFGYRRIKLDHQKGYSLEIVPEQADIVKLIFDLYTKGEQQPDGTYSPLGSGRIAQKLNEFGYKSAKGGRWTLPSVSDIIKNPTYIGKLRWNRRKTEKNMNLGVVESSRPVNQDYILVDALHEPIISVDQFNLAQSVKSTRHHPPVTRNREPNNPLCGLIVCGCCGHNMFRRPAGSRCKYDVLMCTFHGCPTVSSKLETIEQRLLQGIREWLENYKLEMAKDESVPSEVLAFQNTIISLKKEKETLQNQLNSAFDFLEQGIYTPEMFGQRNILLNNSISKIDAQLKRVESQIDVCIKLQRAQEIVIPKFETVLEIYDSLPTAAAKNKLLKTVLDKVVYTKSIAGTKKVAPDQFSLKLYPLIN